MEPAPRRAGLLEGFANVSMPQLVRVMIPLTIVFVLVFVLQYRAQVSAERAGLQTEETSAIERGVRRVERELGLATRDLLFVADLAAERPADLERSLLAFARHRPGYFQVRVLDDSGREVVRIENAADGARITPPSGLQSKRGRRYFGETMRLAAGEVYVSPMELNAEHGEIELPHRPVLRLATPIDDAAGRRLGIVVLNAHGDHFLRAFPRNPDPTGTQRMIVNSEGFWLQHRPEVEWGFALEHGRSFQRTFPDVWPQLLATPHGQVESGDGLFFVDTVDPPGWRFISVVPRQRLDDIAVAAATPLLVMAIPAYFALLLVGWFVVAARQRRRLADEALRSLGELRSAMMNAALDGIVVMDRNGVTVDFSRSACEIFGYTRSEVRGRLVADLIIPPTLRETHRQGLEHYLLTGEGPIIDKHIDELTAMRKGGEEFPVELTVCPVMLAGRRFFYGFLRDLSSSSR